LFARLKNWHTSNSICSGRMAEVISLVWTFQI